MVVFKPSSSPNDPDRRPSPLFETPSLTAFYAGSLGIFSLGTLVGVYRVYKLSKKENLTIPKGSGANASVVAARALLYGTALCLGTFSGAAALFAYTSKITTPEEFRKATKSVIGRYLPFVVTTEKQYEACSDEVKAETVQIENDISKYLEKLLESDEEETSSLGSTGNVDTQKKGGVFLKWVGKFFNDTNGNDSKKQTERNRVDEASSLSALELTSTHTKSNTNTKTIHTKNPIAAVEVSIPHPTDATAPAGSTLPIPQRTWVGCWMGEPKSPC